MRRQSYESLDEARESLKLATLENGWPCVMIGTLADEDAVPVELLSCFKQEIVITVRLLRNSGMLIFQAPDEAERLMIARDAFQTYHLALTCP